MIHQSMLPKHVLRDKRDKVFRLSTCAFIQNLLIYFHWNWEYDDLVDCGHVDSPIRIWNQKVKDQANCMPKYGQQSTGRGLFQPNSILGRKTVY